MHRLAFVYGDDVEEQLSQFQIDQTSVETKSQPLTPHLLSSPYPSGIEESRLIDHPITGEKTMIVPYRSAFNEQGYLEEYITGLLKTGIDALIVERLDQYYDYISAEFNQQIWHNYWLGGHWSGWLESNCKNQACNKASPGGVEELDFHKTAFNATKNQAWLFDNGISAAFNKYSYNALCKGNIDIGEMRLKTQTNEKLQAMLRAYDLIDGQQVKTIEEFSERLPYRERRRHYLAQPQIKRLKDTGLCMNGCETVLFYTRFPNRKTLQKYIKNVTWLPSTSIRKGQCVHHHARFNSPQEAIYHQQRLMQHWADASPDELVTVIDYVG